MNLPQLPADKANHFVYGAALAAAGTLAVSPIVGAGLCAAFAVGKEVLDRVRKSGTPEVADALATIAGGAVVVLPHLAPQLAGVLV